MTERRLDPTDAVKDVWTIAGNKVKYTESADEIKLDATQKPKLMEIKHDTEDGTEKLQAIYAIEAGTLKICVDAEKKGRPSKFESKRGSGYLLFALKRVPE